MMILPSASGSPPDQPYAHKSNGSCRKGAGGENVWSPAARACARFIAGGRGVKEGNGRVECEGGSERRNACM